MTKRFPKDFSVPYQTVSYDEMQKFLEGLKFVKSIIRYKLEFDSIMIGETDLQKIAHRLLEVDNRVILPVRTQIRFIITSTDVLHS